MNFTVHGIMYFYYFLMAAGMYKLASKFAGFVTAMQITQMLVRGPFFAIPEIAHQCLASERLRFDLGSRLTERACVLQVGTVVMGLAGYYFLTEGEEKCYNNKDNVMLGIAMYISYFLLFAGGQNLLEYPLRIVVHCTVVLIPVSAVSAAFAVKRYLLPAKKKPSTAKKTQ